MIASVLQLKSQMRGFMKSYYYGALEFCRSLGLSSLSWAFYHTAASVRELVSERMERTSFLAILSTLASMYYGITNMDWDEPNASIWLGYMEQVDMKEVEESQIHGGECQSLENHSFYSMLCSFIDTSTEPTICLRGSLENLRIGTGREDATEAAYGEDTRSGSPCFHPKVHGIRWK